MYMELILLLLLLLQMIKSSLKRFYAVVEFYPTDFFGNRLEHTTVVEFNNISYDELMILRTLYVNVCFESLDWKEL